MNHLELLTEHGHILPEFQAVFPKPPGKSGLMFPAPVFQGAVSFSLPGGKLRRHLVKGKHLEPEGADNANRPALPVGDDAVISFPGKRLFLLLVTPQGAGGGSLNPPEHQKGELFRIFPIIAEVPGGILFFGVLRSFPQSGKIIPPESAHGSMFFHEEYLSFQKISFFRYSMTKSAYSEKLFEELTVARPFSRRKEKNLCIP